MANIRSVPRVFFAHESVTVAASSIGLTQATYEPAATINERGPAEFALLTVETDQIRWYVDGSDADSSGHLAEAGDVIELHGIKAIRAFRAIRVTTSATVRASYAR